MDATSYDAVCLGTSAVILASGCAQLARGRAAWLVVAAAGAASLLMRGGRCALRRRCGVHNTSPAFERLDQACAALALGAAVTGRLGSFLVVPGAIASALLLTSALLMEASPPQRLVHVLGHVVAASALAHVAIAGRPRRHTHCTRQATLPTRRRGREGDSSAPAPSSRSASALPAYRSAPSSRVAVSAASASARWGGATATSTR